MNGVRRTVALPSVLSVNAADTYRAAASQGLGLIQTPRYSIEQDLADGTLMECLPAAETRAYVQRVLAGYWTYRTMWGQASPSLDALASGDRAIDERLDYLGQASRPARQLASETLQVGMR